MPQYVILTDHTPDICPSSNSRSRARAIDGMGQQLHTLATDSGITFTTELLHLDPGHRMVAVVDAPTIEAVTELVYAAGLTQWNTVDVWPATPAADFMANLDAFPIVFG
jgi:hypothetical protein